MTIDLFADETIFSLVKYICNLNVYNACEICRSCNACGEEKCTRVWVEKSRKKGTANKTY